MTDQNQGGTKPEKPTSPPSAGGTPPPPTSGMQEDTKRLFDNFQEACDDLDDLLAQLTEAQSVLSDSGADANAKAVARRDLRRGIKKAPSVSIKVEDAGIAMEQRIKRLRKGSTGEPSAPRIVDEDKGLAELTSGVRVTEDVVNAMLEDRSPRRVSEMLGVSYTELKDIFVFNRYHDS